LRNSSLSVFYSTKYLQLLPDDPPALAPDIFVEVSAADYFAARDPVLEKLLAIRSRRRP